MFSGDAVAKSRQSARALIHRQQQTNGGYIDACEAWVRDHVAVQRDRIGNDQSSVEVFSHAAKRYGIGHCH